MDKSKRWISMFLFCSAVVLGCGDDDSSPAKAHDGGLDGGNKDASAEAGATGGTGGKTTTGGTGGTAAPMPVKCGSKTCSAGGGALAGLPGGIGAGLAPMACCVDEKAGTCGMMVMGKCSLPPKTDPSCPSVNFPVIGMMGSCCADDGKCGLDGSALGQGCVDYKMVTSMLGVFGGLITLPPEQSCGSKPEDDGGMPPDASMSEQDGGH
jgi:hypothetical protein